MNLRQNSKKIVIAISLIALAIGLFFVHALAGIAASPVTFSAPPAFVAQYAAERYHFDNSTPHNSKAKLTTDYFNEAALVRNVIVNGEPTDELIKLFTHPDKAQRIKIAVAFGEVNIKLSHDEGTGFDDKRKQFWLDVHEHSADIQNALFEALIATAQERTRSFIPYTLAWWMKEQKPKAVDMLAWAAKHHPDPWVRNFSVYYVIQFGQNEAHARDLLQDRTHDPAFKVRKRILEQRFRRFAEMLFGKEEEAS